MKRERSLRPSPSLGPLSRSLGRPPGTALPRLSLFRRARRVHVDAHELAAQLAVAERDAAVRKRKEGVVLAHADAGTWIIFGAALAHDDVAGEDILAAELLHAEPLALGVAAVAGRTACFLMCHDETLASYPFICLYRPPASLSKPSSSACRSSRPPSARTWPAPRPSPLAPWRPWAWRPSPASPPRALPPWPAWPSRA